MDKINERNAAQALIQGLITWFEYFEILKGTPRSEWIKGE